MDSHSSPMASPRPPVGAYATACLLVLLSCACGSERDRGAALEARVTEPPARPAAITVQRLVREYRPGLADPLGLYDPSDLTVVADRLYIVERRNDRVTVTDTLFNLVRRFGRRGEGPGELKMPWGIERLPSGHLAVTEVGNARISIFGLDGDFVRSVPRATPHDAPAGLDDTTYVVSGPGGGFGSAIRYGPGGVGEPFGRTGGPRRDLMAITADPATRLRVDDEDRVAIVRAREGAIEVYDRSGRLLRADTLPGDVLERLESQRRGLVEGLESQGMSVLSSSLVKRPSATEFGELLIPLSMPEPFALLYSPRDGRFSRLNAPESPRERAILQSASAAFLDRRTLYLTQGGGIAVFRLPEE